MPEDPPDVPDPTTRSLHACLARLREMDAALARMQEELPEDVAEVGEQARRTVQRWLSLLGQGGADLSALPAALHEVAGLMDALTARLLLVPWDGHPPAPRRPS